MKTQLPNNESNDGPSNFKEPLFPKKVTTNGRKRKSDESVTSTATSTTSSVRGRRIIPPRRSSVEFVDRMSDSFKPKKVKVKRERAIVPQTDFVATSCGKDDLNLVKQVVAHLGKHKVAREVTRNTSHVIVGDDRRTVNLLKGILFGCWVVRKEWVLKCLEEGYYLDEEPHEASDTFPAVARCRVERQSFGDAYKSTLFKQAGKIFFSKRCKMPHADLTALLALGGGKLAATARSAAVIVGERKLNVSWRSSTPMSRGSADAECVDEKWFLDSIQDYEVKSVDSYRLV